MLKPVELYIPESQFYHIIILKIHAPTEPTSLLGWRWGNSVIMNDRLILATAESHFSKAFTQHAQPRCPSEGLLHASFAFGHPHSSGAMCTVPRDLPTGHGWAPAITVTFQADPVRLWLPLRSVPQPPSSPSHTPTMLCRSPGLCTHSSPSACCLLGSQLRGLLLREALPEPSIHSCSKPSSVCASTAFTFFPFYETSHCCCLSSPKRVRGCVILSPRTILLCHINIT